MSDTVTHTLSAQEIEYYSRQLILADWGIEQQLRLKAATVAVSSELRPAIQYLAGAGVGTLLLFGQDETALVSLCNSVAAVNSFVTVTPFFHQASYLDLDAAIVTAADQFEMTTVPATMLCVISSEQNSSILRLRTSGGFLEEYHLPRPELSAALAHFGVDSLLAALLVTQTIGQARQAGTRQQNACS